MRQTSKNKIKSLILFGIYFSVAPAAGASIKINEIMYDLPGSDTGREWVEVKNDSGGGVDISAYYFREGGTSHKLIPYSGGNNINANSYAVIADNPEKFLVDNPSFSGVLFDSSFSLSNTGEALSILNGDTIEDSVNYESSLGGNGDGNSLSLVSNSFVSGTPSPGKENIKTTTTLDSGATSASQQASSSSNQVESNQSNSSSWPVEQQVFADAGPDKTTFVGIPLKFDGVLLGLKKEPIDNARFIWNFGDGGVSEGKTVSHIYYFPGKYLVSMQGVSGHFSNGDTLAVEVNEINIYISSFKSGQEGFVEIVNKSSNSVNVSGVIISDGVNDFSIPDNTIILGKSSIKFPNKLLGLFFTTSGPFLKYGNGSPVVVSPPNMGSENKVSVPPSKTSNEASVAKYSQNVTIPHGKSVSGVLASVSDSGAVGVIDPDNKWVFGGLAIFLAIFSSLVIIFLRRTRIEADKYEIFEEE
jgi:uncharacterized protein YkvS